MENRNFHNPKLQKLYEALCDLFPDRTGWQDMGDEECEMISLVIDIKDNFNDGTTISQTLAIDTDGLTIYPEHLPEQDSDGYVVFAFEN